MSSLYPSLEDMKFDELAKAQNDAIKANLSSGDNAGVAMYPPLGEFMGLELTRAIISENMPEYLDMTSVVVATQPTPTGVVAPLSAGTTALQQTDNWHSIRSLVLCKDADGKIGLKVQSINNGIFVCLVIENSPAEKVGLRFGDQILQLNDTVLAGYSPEKFYDLIRKGPTNGIRMAVRNRPFERVVVLHKDTTGSVGFQFKDGKIKSIVKDSSAARNGVLTDHQLLEVNGRNVVGMKDKHIAKVFEEAGNVVSITIVPSFIYKHMIKTMPDMLMKHMSHVTPDV